MKITIDLTNKEIEHIREHTFYDDCIREHTFYDDCNVVEDIMNKVQEQANKIKIKQPKIYYDLDKNIGMRVAHIKKGKWLISLATGRKHKFKRVKK